jgi:molybdate transport system ATP-binding protein
MSEAETSVATTAAAAVSSQPAPQLRAEFRKRLAHQARDFVLNVNLEVPTGFTILFGASGSGKTTLLDCVAGLSTPDAGSIYTSARVLFDSSQRVDVPVAQRHVGYVLQDLALFPHMTVAQNVAFGLTHLSHSARTERISAMLESFRISHLAERRPREISGGEAQRVALARTLVTNPQLLLLDEPLAALDAPTKSQIINDLSEWNRAHNIPILYVTHSRDEVFALGERVIVLDAGRIVAQGTPHEVMTAPMQETVAQLAGFENVFDAEVQAVRPERGTMTCRIAGEGGAIFLETPLVRGGAGSALRIGIRAGDILLATSPPIGLSARNVIPGRILSLAQRDVIVSAQVKSRVTMEVHLTLAARDSLQLEPGKEVWLVIKTHSCHLMRPPGE